MNPSAPSSTSASNNLDYITIVSSDEPLLMMEFCDEIIKQSKSLGVSERTIVDVNDKTNWNELLVESGSLSLFAEVKLTDIRFAKPPNKEAQTALVELLNSAGPENFFLIRLPKIEKRQKNTKWFKALTQLAKPNELWPPRPEQLQSWVVQRAKSLGLNLTQDAIQVLIEQTEGNLLAASQTLEKLCLLERTDSIDVESLRAVSADNAKFSVFMCLDEALAGRGARAVRMLHKFAQEDIAPIVIVSNLAREVSLCKSTALATQSGQSAMQALSKTYLWDSKKRLIAGAVNRLPAAVWQKLMIRCAFLDRMIKGQESGNIWQEIELCLWMISGTRVWGRKQ